MELAPIDYLIHDIVMRHRQVSGWAVNSYMPVRFCVRKTVNLGWCADDNDTGLSVLKFARSRADAVERAVEVYDAALFNGSYKRVMSAWLKGKHYSQRPENNRWAR